MIDPIIGSALLGLGGNILSNLWNTHEQRRTNEQMMQFNERQAGIQRNWSSQEAIAAWLRNIAGAKYQNQYNAPINQVARLKQAGLNPALMYGGSAGGGIASAIISGTQASGGSAASANLKAAQIGNLLNNVNAVETIKNTRANTGLAQSSEGLNNQLRTESEWKATKAQAQIKEILARAEAQEIENKKAKKTSLRVGENASWEREIIRILEDFLKDKEGESLIDKMIKYATEQREMAEELSRKDPERQAQRDKNKKYRDLKWRLDPF